MGLGANLQYLRKTTSMTQEKLAERLGVSRQTVSKWEADEACPEVPKLLELCDAFSVKLDALLREDLSASADVYSPVTVKTVKGFRMARYVMISPNPECDVNAYMDEWARRSGLAAAPGEHRRIGWDFPFVTPEQKNRFGLRGYAAAFVLPEGFEPACAGAEIACQGDARYAVITVRDPFSAPFERIPRAYERILAHLNCNSFKGEPGGEALSCFESEFVQDGVTYMEIYVLTDGVCKTSAFHSPS